MLALSGLHFLDPDFRLLGALKREIGLKIGKKPGSGSPVPNKEKVGTITRGQLEKLAAEKFKDMNAGSIEAAARTLAGTCRSMGVDVTD